MEQWQAWLEAAEEAFAAAQILENVGHLRSAASRYYYAAYMAATATLHYRDLSVPPDRKGWSHDTTPDLLREQLQPLGVL